MRRVLSVAVAVVTLVAAVSVYAQDAKKDLQRLQGDWAVLESVGGGKPLPEKVIKEIKISFKAQKMIVDGGAAFPRREYLFRLVPSKEIKAFDVTALDGPFKGKTVPAIYEFDGDGLKLCVPIRETKKRPTEFESVEGSHVGLWVLKRIK